MSFSGFNSHIWHALWILAVPIVAVFIGCFFPVRNYSGIKFDARHLKGATPDAGDFGPHLQRYTDLAKLSITLSAGVIAFLINTLVGQKPPVTDFAQKVADNAPIVVGFFGAAIALLIGFVLAATFFYEQYCHSLDHSSYKAWKYATVLSLGWGGLFAFVLGFCWLALSLFS
jgi:hypothetical protein